MAFSESLTIRILGDSSELQRELDVVLNRFDTLKGRISESSTAARRFSNSFNRLSQAMGPLQQVSNAISRIGQQLRGISQAPVSINVAPALQSLQQVAQAAQRASAAVRAVSSISPLGQPAPIAPQGRVGSVAPRGMTNGGLVTGRPGIDRVPAQLTAGEYVINRESVKVLGLGYLEKLNGVKPISSPNSLVSNSDPRQDVEALRSLQVTPRTVHAPRDIRQSTKTVTHSTSSNVTNHFGGITVQVTDQTDAESFMRDLQLRGVGQRIRQG